MLIMKTQRLNPRLPAMLLVWLTACAWAVAHANEVDEQGRVIAGPLETDLVERGYLFYPLRVLPKPVAATVAGFSTAGGAAESVAT